MFEALTEKLTGIFRKLGAKGRLTEKDVDEALKEVRLALLEADVNFKVARELVARVRERALNAQVLESLSPGHQVMKIVHEEMTAVLGGSASHLSTAPKPPTVVMLVGLQGSGKTTTAAKLALHLKRSGKSALLVAADLRRPAAVEQLEILGKQHGLPVYSEGVSSPVLRVAQNGVAQARRLGVGWVLLDTGGRLHIDDAMMKELEQLKAALNPHEVLLVVDAMTGQDAVREAQEFHQRVGLTGLVLTKMDGDARGGAALSITSVTGVPIKFIGVGEKVEALEPFYPQRLASRILGMGDILSLVEKAQAQWDQKRAKELERKLKRATFDLEDFREQIQQLRRIGTLDQILEMIPGLSPMARGRVLGDLDEKSVRRMEAIILSMTPQERRNPEIIDGSRKRRIARGSGTTIQDVNHLLNQFHQARSLMREISSGRFPKLGRFLRGLF